MPNFDLRETTGSKCTRSRKPGSRWIYGLLENTLLTHGT